MRIAPAALALLLAACSGDAARDLGADAGGPGADAGEEQPGEDVGFRETNASLQPKPLGVVIRSMGERQHGPLRVLVEEREDGKVHFMVHRLIREDGSERVEVGGGVSFAEDASAPWFVYLHTTSESYAYDGGGGLIRHTFTIELAEGFVPTPEQLEAGVTAVAEGAPMSNSASETLTAGPEWDPGEELRATLPARVLELIEGS